MFAMITDTEKLREVAIDQYGYVTTAQAEDEGVTRHSLAALTKRGRLERVAHGLYRVPQVPETRLDAFMRVILWTGAPEAVLSHDTALDAYEVCDINPTKIHVTVGKGRRIAKAGGEGYVLHRQDIDASQKAWWHRIPIVTLPCAIEQCIVADVPTYLIRQAIENGERSRLLTAEEARILEGELDGRYR
ncbi:type IV toxin-antitoxin system AbiEi family antitoxin domain-containing protein [Arabiibacter massiliensis]|uniref:type IV toxin-antitoxin system AbiEi family antitoxin domain-containing protein n=1 Tax=Arabiibacter massiliensis TaxID=1870985 RepID=UPI0009BB6F2E|nr:type IV toxin-antitoxin system AbiEi family antitoxin domain-containing protein [Arabiibacter massiliensis]